ncbi:MAG TPA: EAL domain-containing protein [Gammaproteobacteria bacterium]|nr:EAL domain-containing protein [Gammaproteobacteria bacterium]
MDTAVDTHFRILIIDDNPSIHHDFIKILKTESLTDFDQARKKLFGSVTDTTQTSSISFPLFEIDTASHGEEGAERIRKAFQAGEPYALAFVDIRMPPGWDGIETIKHIWEIDKNIQIVICTAYSDYSWEETVAHLGKTDNLLILKKPFDNVSVRQLAFALTTKWKLGEETRNYTANLQKQVTDRTVSLQKTLSIVKSTFESSNDGIIVIDNEGTIVDYNNKLVSLLGIPESVIFTRREEEFLLHIQNQLENPENFLSILENIHKNPDKNSIDVIKFKNGKIFECYTQPHTLDKKIIGRVMDFRDITRRANLEEKLKFQATHDLLTGLSNRVELMDKMKLAIKLSQLNHSSFAVLFLDLDRFKLINDSLSHQVGDELLIQVADRLKTSIRAEDALARIGGDEFVILLMNIKSEEDVDDKVKSILMHFQKPFNIAERQITMTTSIGIGIYPKDGAAVDVLLRNADSAMYSSKAKKGNIYQFYTEKMNEKNLDALDREVELRKAIENNEFFLVYQPQFDLAKQKIVAAEALIRWKHPTKGVLLPIDFMPLAEETGLIVPIGEWVLRKACLQIMEWKNANLPMIRVAVNVTSHQFKHYDLVGKIDQILKETHLDPKFLEIELTENVILSNPEIIKAITELKKLGVIIAIDDFGTGYSSLSYLHKIPLDRLKIDGSFIRHIHSPEDDEVIIRAIIAMAKNLNLEVLAEGVETTDQLNFLKKYDCDDIQGFYFSVPLTSEKIKEYLRNPEKSSLMKDFIQK